MAIRSEELVYRGEAVIYRLPLSRARGRASIEVIRRRVALVAVGVIVVIAAMVGTGPQGIAPAATPGGARTVVVRPGQTLWDVAERFAPASVDPRAYLDALIARNGGSASVSAGTTLHLP